MKKRILSMLLVVCMVVGFLPATTLHFHAHAEDVPTSTTIQVNGVFNLGFTETAQYALTDAAGAISGTSVVDEAVDPWNIKYQMVNGVAVMTLKGATIGYFDEAAGTFTTGADKSALGGHADYTPAPLKIVVQEDSSMAATAYNINGNTSITSVTIESVGDAKLDMIHNGGYPGIAVDEVNFVNANVTLTRYKTGYVNSALIKCKKLNVTGGDVSVKGSAYSGTNFVVNATESAVIDGAKFYVENVGYAKGLTTPSLTIKGGADVTLTTSTGYTGMLDVTDAVVEGDSSLYVYSAGTQAIVATGTFTVNSGSVKANCSTTPMTGALVMNGGKVILQSRGCKQFATVTPVLPEDACYTVKTGATVDVAATTTQTLEFLSGSNTYQRQAEILFEHNYTVSTGEKVLDATRYNPAQYRAKCSKCGATSDTALVGVGDVAAAGTNILTLLTEYNGWVKWSFNTGYAQYLDVTDDTGTVAWLTGADELNAIINDTWDIKLEVVDGEAVMTLNGVNLGKYDAETDTFASKGGAHVFGGNAGSGYGVAPVRVVVKKDSTLAAANTVFNSNGSISSLTIESIDNAKLTMINNGAWVGGAIAGVTDINFVNANVEIKDTATTNVTGITLSCANLSMVNSNVTVSKRIHGYVLKAINATEAITIDGGTFNGITTLHGHVLAAPTVTIKNGAQVTLTAGSAGISGATDVYILDPGTKVVVHGQTGSIGTTNLSFGGKPIKAFANSQPVGDMTSVSEEYLLSDLSAMKQVSIEVVGVTYSVTLPGDVVLTTSPDTNSVSYAKTDAAGNVTAADESDWNIKFATVDGVATLYLKGAVIGSVADGVWSVEQSVIAAADTAKLNIVVLEDSTLTAKGSAVSGVTDLTITSEGDAKLTLVNYGEAFGLTPATLTIDANLVMNTNGTNQWGKCISVTTLNIVGGNVVIDSMTDTYVGKPGVYAETINISGDANVTINNNLYGYAVEAKSMTVSGNAVVNLNAPTVVLSIIDSLTVEGGTLNVFCTVGHGGGTESGIITTDTGAITVNGGTLTVDKAKNTNWMHGIWIKGAGSFTVNGGTVVVHNGTAHSRYGLYLQAGGVATVNGGDVTINGYDHRSNVDEEGNKVVTNYDMGNGAVCVGEGSSLTVKGGKATFRSGITPVVGLLTVEDGEVILISHKYAGNQFLDTVPVLPEDFCISMSNSAALDGADSIGSSIDMLTKVQAYHYCRIGAHTEVAIEDDYIKRPTCVEPGIMAQTVRCEHCLKILSSENEVEVPATGIHTPSGIVIENEVAPTLTTAGSRDEVTYCNICSKELTRETVTIDPIGDTPAFIVENVTVAPGTQNVVVKIAIANNPGVVGVQLTIGYDADKLELVSFADTAVLGGWFTPDSMVSENPLYITWEDGLAEQNNTANGDILILTFNVKEGATGNAAITVSYDPENVYDFDLNNVTLATYNGGITIQEAHEHSYVDTVVPPTETEQGYTEHVCSGCGDTYRDNYTDPTGPAGPVDVNNVDGWFTVTNDDAANTDWVISVFFLDENSVEDPVNDFAEMVELGKLHPDMNGMNGYRMYNGLQNVLITRAGNYVVRVRYTDAEGNVQLIGKCFAIDTVATRVNIVNNKVVITGLPENPQTVISVYYLGDQEVSAGNYGAVGEAGKKYPEINGENGFRQYSSVNAIYLGNVGNYAIRATYVPAGGGARELLTLNFTIDEATPGLTVADNKLTVNGVPAGATNLSVGVFYLGDKGVDNPAIEWNALVSIGKEYPIINSAQGYRTYKDASAVYLGNLGNYAIRVSYKDAEGNTVLLAEQFLIDSVIPGLTVANNKLTAQGFPAGSDPTFSVFYLGEETVPEPGSDAAWNQLITIGKKYESINSTSGYRAYTNPNVVYLNNVGNYVIRASYTDSTGARKTVAAQLYIDTVVPGINVSDNRVSLVGVPYTSTITMSVVYIGENTITDPIAEWNTIQALGKQFTTENGSAGIKYFSNHNDIFLGYTGNWVIRLVLKDTAGNVTVAATQVTVDSISTVPTMTVTNGKLSAGNMGANTVVGYSVFYLGENQLTDMNDWNLLVATGKLFPEYNDASGYKFYGSLSTVKFPATGNYVIRMAYNDANGVRQTSAIQQIVTVK